MNLDWYRKRTKAKKSIRISIRTRVVKMVNRMLKDNSKFFKLKRDASMMEQGGRISLILETVKLEEIIKHSIEILFIRQLAIWI